jgi:hypothetical protein
MLRPTSNFKSILKYRQMRFQPRLRGAWLPSLEWYFLRDHWASTGSTFWNRTAKAWKIMNRDIAIQAPCTYMGWLSSNFWFGPGQDILGIRFGPCLYSTLASSISVTFRLVNINVSSRAPRLLADTVSSRKSLL